MKQNRKTEGKSEELSLNLDKISQIYSTVFTKDVEKQLSLVESRIQEFDFEKTFNDTVKDQIKKKIMQFYSNIMLQTDDLLLVGSCSPSNSEEDPFLDFIAQTQKALSQKILLKLKSNPKQNINIFDIEKLREKFLCYLNDGSSFLSFTEILTTSSINGLQAKQQNKDSKDNLDRALRNKIVKFNGDLLEQLEEITDGIIQEIDYKKKLFSEMEKQIRENQNEIFQLIQIFNEKKVDCDPEFSETTDQLKKLILYKKIQLKVEEFDQQKKKSLFISAFSFLKPKKDKTEPYLSILQFLKGPILKKVDDIKTNHPLFYSSIKQKQSNDFSLFKIQSIREKISQDCQTYQTSFFDSINKILFEDNGQNLVANLLNREILAQYFEQIKNEEDILLLNTLICLVKKISKKQEEILRISNEICLECNQFENEFNGYFDNNICSIEFVKKYRQQTPSSLILNSDKLQIKADLKLDLIMQRLNIQPFLDAIQNSKPQSQILIFCYLSSHLEKNIHFKEYIHQVKSFIQQVGSFKLNIATLQENDRSLETWKISYLFEQINSISLGQKNHKFDMLLMRNRIQEQISFSSDEFINELIFRNMTLEIKVLKFNCLTILKQQHDRLINNRLLYLWQVQYEEFILDQKQKEKERLQQEQQLQRDRERLLQENQLQQLKYEQEQKQLQLRQKQEQLQRRKQQEEKQLYIRLQLEQQQKLKQEEEQTQQLILQLEQQQRLKQKEEEDEQQKQLQLRSNQEQQLRLKLQEEEQEQQLKKIRELQLNSIEFQQKKENKLQNQFNSLKNEQIPQQKDRSVQLNNCSVPEQLFNNHETNNNNQNISIPNSNYLTKDKINLKPCSQQKYSDCDAKFKNEEYESLFNKNQFPNQNLLMKPKMQGDLTQININEKSKQFIQKDGAPLNQIDYQNPKNQQKQKNTTQQNNFMSKNTVQYDNQQACATMIQDEDENQQIQKQCGINSKSNQKQQLPIKIPNQNISPNQPDQQCGFPQPLKRNQIIQDNSFGIQNQREKSFDPNLNDPLFSNQASFNIKDLKQKSENLPSVQKYILQSQQQSRNSNNTELQKTPKSLFNENKNQTMLNNQQTNNPQIEFFNQEQSNNSQKGQNSQKKNINVGGVSRETNICKHPAEKKQIVSQAAKQKSGSVDYSKKEGEQKEDYDNRLRRIASKVYEERKYTSDKNKWIESIIKQMRSQPFKPI